jgi:radical SAM protein with 4Fe4S-binding SPASM domain
MMKNFKTPPLLKGIDFSKEEVLTTRQSNRMLMLNIETSAVCNLRCLYCYLATGRRLKNELNLKEYKLIIDQAVDMGTKVITIAGYGEPFCDKNLWKILQYIHRRHLYLILSTNNTLVTKEVARRLFEMDVSIIATLNSMKPDVQNRLAGKQYVHKKIRQGLHNLLEAGFNGGNPTRIAVDLFMMKDNYEEMPDLFRYARYNNIFPFVCRLLCSGRAKENSLDVTDEEFKDMMYQILEIDKNEFGYSWIPHPPYAGSLCQNIYYSMVVGVEGEVRPCYGVFINVGNIREKSLMELWNNPLLVKMRNIKKYIKGKCQDCKIVEECYGCRCRTFALIGDPFASDPTCWYR